MGCVSFKSAIKIREFFATYVCYIGNGYAVPCTTVCVTPSHTPGPIFHGRYVHRSNSAGAKQKKAAFEPSRRELSEDVSFGIGALLVVEQSAIGL